VHDQIKNNALNLINLKNSQGFTQTGAIIESQYSVEFLSWLSTQIIWTAKFGFNFT